MDVSRTPNKARCTRMGSALHTAAGFVLDQPKKGDVLKQPKDKLVQMQEGYTSELDSALWGESTVWAEEEWKQKATETGTLEEPKSSALLR